MSSSTGVERDARLAEDRVELRVAAESQVQRLEPRQRIGRAVPDDDGALVRELRARVGRRVEALRAEVEEVELAPQVGEVAAPQQAQREVVVGRPRQRLVEREPAERACAARAGRSGPAAMLPVDERAAPRLLARDQAVGVEVRQEVDVAVRRAGS